MNDVLTKGIIKMVRSFVTPDQIKAIAADLTDRAISQKDKVNIDATQGEADVAAIFYESGGKGYFAVVILDMENNFVRFENIQTIDSLIEKLIENF